MADRKSPTAYDPATYRSHTNRGRTTTVFSGDMPHRAPVLCYIAGIECPLQAATVSYGVWKIPEASITMFPDPQLQRFGAEDRVPVVLFYLDEYIEPAKPQWRLLFEGEIVGWSYMNAAGSRSLEFSCVMNIALWTQLFIQFMTSLSSLALGIAAKGTNPAVNTQAQAVPNFSLFRHGLLRPGDSTAGGVDDYIKRPFDFAYNVVRSLISSDLPDKHRCVPGINFFARWTRREQFHNRWVALPLLEETPTETKADGSVVASAAPGIFPVLRAAQSLAAVQAIENHIAAKYSGGSIYTILKQVLDSVLMELCMLPTAPCVSTRTDGVIRGEPVFRTEQQKTAAKNNAVLAGARKVLQAELDTHSLAAEAKHKVAPKGDYKPLSEKAKKAAEEAKKEAATNSSAHLDTLLEAFRAAQTSTSELLFTDIGPTELRGALSNLDRLEAKSVDTGPKDATLPTRLGNYFVKPQMMFGLPPACNVVFPSMTPNLTYQESYVTQPTRFYLQDSHAIHYAGFADSRNASLKATVMAAISRAYPPEADVKWRAHINTDAAKSGRNLLIWPEEFFKGPVMASQPAPPWLLFIASAEQGKTGAPKGATDATIYALYAQYEYFRLRYEARSGAVTSAFHPYLVPGLPTMVFDNFQSSLHTIGYLMNVTHQFSPRSVNTSMNYTYGRTLHEFFDLMGKEMNDGGALADRKDLKIAAAPTEPIAEVRDVIQQFGKAEQFYQGLLYRRKPVRAVAQYQDLIAMVKGDGTLEDIKIEGVTDQERAALRTEWTAAKVVLEGLSADSSKLTAYAQEKLDPDAMRAIRRAAATALGTDEGNAPSTLDANDLAGLLGKLGQKLAVDPKALHNLSDVLGREFVPKPGAEPYFDSYDAAMKYCARPICTLDEYVEFIGGVREGPEDGFAYSSDESAPSARYYARIRKLTSPPPGFVPTAAQRGTEAPTAIGTDFPEMRADWARALWAYRRNIYAKSTAQR